MGEIDVDLARAILAEALVAKVAHGGDRARIAPGAPTTPVERVGERREEVRFATTRKPEGTNQSKKRTLPRHNGIQWGSALCHDTTRASESKKCAVRGVPQEARFAATSGSH